MAAQTACLVDKLFRRQLLGCIYPDSPEYLSKLKQCIKRPVAVYAGFDATSSSLHVGNLATIMNLIHFQSHGHRVVCVIGDATTQVGDPSGHDHDRKKIDRNVITRNAESIEETLKRLFANHTQYFKPVTSEPQKPIFVRNSQWYKGIEAVDFIGEIFREVRVGPLLHKKSISERLKTNVGMNMSEFCYQIFQAYDWLQLRKLYNCRLQIGGSDQAGNIYTGYDLIKKCTGETDSIGLLAPLIVSDSGKKLGKSADSNIQQDNIWLRPEKTSPYKLYQFFQRTPDKDVEKFLKIFSLYDERTIEDLIQTHLKKPEDVWYCQRKLAEHVCQLVHGEAGLESARRITHAFYQRNPLDIAKLSDEELKQLFDEDSVVHMLHRDGLSILDLIRATKCFKSDLDAERVISAGGFWLNGARVTSFNVPITEDLIIGNGITVLRVGKRNYYLIKWAPVNTVYK